MSLDDVSTVHTFETQGASVGYAWLKVDNVQHINLAYSDIHSTKEISFTTR